MEKFFLKKGVIRFRIEILKCDTVNREKWKTFGGRIDKIWTNTVVNSSRDQQDAYQSHLFFLGTQLDSIPGLHSISWHHVTEFQVDRRLRMKVRDDTSRPISLSLFLFFLPHHTGME